MSLFPEGNGLNKNHDPGIWSTTPEFGSKRTPHLRSTVPNVQRHMAYFATGLLFALVAAAAARPGDVPLAAAPKGEAWGSRDASK
jgi:hypothetical protein